MNISLVKASEDATLSGIISKIVNDSKKQGQTQKHEASINKMVNKSVHDVTAGISNMLEEVNIASENDIIKIVLEFTTQTKSKGSKYKQYISFDVTKIFTLNSEYILEWCDKLTFKELAGNYAVKVTCDCQSFKYHFSNMHKRSNSLYLGKYSTDDKSYSTKGLYTVNPNSMGGLCKHLITDALTLSQKFDMIKVEIKKFATKFIENFKNEEANVIDSNDYGKLSIHAIKERLREYGITRYGSKTAKSQLITWLKQQDELMRKRKAEGDPSVINEDVPKPPPANEPPAEGTQPIEEKSYAGKHILLYKQLREMDTDKLYDLLKMNSIPYTGNRDDVDAMVEHYMTSKYSKEIYDTIKKALKNSGEFENKKKSTAKYDDEGNRVGWEVATDTEIDEIHDKTFDEYEAQKAQQAVQASEDQLEIDDDVETENTSEDIERENAAKQEKLKQEKLKQEKLKQEKLKQNELRKNKYKKESMVDDESDSTVYDDRNSPTIDVLNPNMDWSKVTFDADDDTISII